MAADFFVVPTATCRLLFVLVILAHERRRVVHVAVTEHPTAAWTAQQLREAFPWDESPRYLIRDRDHAFNAWANTATGDGYPGDAHRPTLAVAERVRRTIYWVRSPRVPGSRHRLHRARAAPRLERLRGILPALPNASRAGKRRACLAARRFTRGWRHRGDSSTGWLAPPLRTPRCVAHASQGAVPTVGASAPKRAPQCARFQSRVRLTRQLASNTTFFPIALQARGEMMPSRGSIVFIEDANGPSPIEFSVKTGSPRAGMRAVETGSR